MINRLLEEKELQDTLKVIFAPEPKIPDPGKLEPMPPFGDENSQPLSLSTDFTGESSENEFDQFIKDKMKKEFGLVENPTETQLEQIINKRQSKPKSKTVYYKEFIDQMADSDADISDFDYDVLDAEIVEKTVLENPIRVKSDTEF